MHREEEVRDAIKTEVEDANLEFCKLDLLEDAGWEDAMWDCDFVMHVASPFVIEDPKDENDLIIPAKEGTLRALKAAKKAGIKRIVVTSSVAAVNSHMMSGTSDHTTWTDINSKYVTPYQKSKTIAERAAWDFINNQDSDGSESEETEDMTYIFGEERRRLLHTSSSTTTPTSSNFSLPSDSVSSTATSVNI